MSKPKPRRSSRPVPDGTANPSPDGVPAPVNPSPGPKPGAKAARSQRPTRRGWDALVFPASVLLVVVAIVLVTYWPAFSAQAHYLDDDIYLGSPALQQPGWASVQRIFGEVLAPSVVYGYYHPLTLVSVMLDFRDPAAASSLLPFHRTSLFLHLFNTALVVVLLYLLFDNWLTAGLVGLLFGLHPLNADAVLWMAERKTVLSTFFALWSLIFYVSYARHADKTRRGDWKRYGAALLMYICALLSKPTALPLAALLPVLDFWPLNRLNRRTLLEKVPFLIVGGLLAVVTFISQQGTASSFSPEDVAYPLGTLPLVICYALVLYLSKLVWPAGLVADYPFPKPFTLLTPSALVGVIGVLLLVLALAFSARRTRAWLVGGLFFFIAIFPALGVIRFTSSIAANRFMYLPMIGLLLPLNWGLNRLWNTTVGVLQVSKVRIILAGVGVVLALACIGVTRAYMVPWQDTVALLQYYLTQSPNDWKLHNRLGGEWLHRGNLDGAIAECIETVRLNPYWATNQLNLGRAMFFAGRFNESEKAFDAALKLEPDNWQAHVLMAKTLLKENETEAALKEFQLALQLHPIEPEIHYDIANILAGQGKLTEAAREYRQTLQLNPDYTEAQSALDAIGSK